MSSVILNKNSIKAKKKRLISFILNMLLTAGVTLTVSHKELRADNEHDKNKHLTLKSHDESSFNITVTATRIVTPIEDLPISVSVIEEKDIEKRNIQHIDTILNTEPGIFIRRTRGIMDTMNRINLRGFPNQARTLIMLDSQPINDSYSSNYNLSGLPPELLKRVEVVRGPFSSLYGGNAMGGAVNFITRMPTKREIILKTGYGSSFERGDALDDLRRFYISYGDTFKDNKYLIGYNRQDTNGFANNYNVQRLKPPADLKGWKLTTDSKGETRYLIGDRGDSVWFNDSLFIKSEHKFSDTKVGFNYILNRRELNYDEPNTYLRDAKGRKIYSYRSGRSTVNEASFLASNHGDEQQIISANFQTKINDISIKFLTGYQDRYNNYSITPSMTSAKIKSGPGKITETPNNTTYFDLQFSKLLLSKHLITFGGTYKTGEVDVVEYSLANWKKDHLKGKKLYEARGSDEVYSLFLQEEFMFSDNLIFYLGLRNDWWRTYDGYVNQIGTKGYPINYSERTASELSPKFSVVYKPTTLTKLSASIGTAFRPPNLYEMYRTWTTTTGITYAGNPNLKPETTTSWEVGIEQELWKGGVFRATYYEDYVKDLIYTKDTTPTYKDKVNAGKAEKYGFELQFEQTFYDNFKFFSNFSYSYGKIKENKAAPNSVNKLLTDIPIKTFNFGLEYERNNFSSSIIARYVGDQFNNDDNSDIINNVFTSYDPYFVVDLKLNYKLNKNITLSLSTDNIFDRDYYAYFKAPGASWFTELTFRY